MQFLTRSVLKRLLPIPLIALGFGLLLGSMDPAAAHGIHGTPAGDDGTGTGRDDVIDLGRGHDTANGRAGDDLLLGRRGRDHLIGGPGADRIRGHQGNDFIVVADGASDDVQCGKGSFDQVIADESDVVDDDCERVVSTAEGRASIVQLGDSVAAGEGTLYGFTWNSNKQWWNPPTDPTPRWNGPYQGCHQSSDAYGSVLAKRMNADFTSFACSGATYAAGVNGPEPAHNVPDSQLQQLFDSGITPDVVLITLGADDVNFHSIVAYCILFAKTTDPPCTQSHPGAPLDLLFWPHYDVTLGPDYQALVTQLQNHFGGPGAPHIIFTTYYSPMEQGPPDASCADSWLTEEQNEYLGTLGTALKTKLHDSLDGMPGVTVVDIDGFITGHTWCTQDPWAYGPDTDVASLDLKEPAGFHPTPAGHQAIADILAPSVTQAMITP